MSKSSPASFHHSAFLSSVRLFLTCLLCLLLNDNRSALAAPTQLAAWGYNGYGQLGNGTNTNSNVPVAITGGALVGKSVIQIANGYYHSLALSSDGTLATWGQNLSGQLGNGTHNNSNVPINITSSGALAGKTVIQISVGDAHSLALCSDGTVAAWGYNQYGELGNGTNTNSNVPIIITEGALADKKVTQIAAGYYHSLALCSDGTLATWGQNNYGQLGNNTNTGSNVPVNITSSGALSGKTVTQIEGSNYYSLALCSDGTVVSWGDNVNGQLGNGTYIDSNIPLNITDSGALSGKTVTQLKAGEFHNLALCSDGTLATWGSNTYGQLGDGTNTRSNIPLNITDKGAILGKTITGISAGDAHSLALCSDGTITAWGQNYYGQLGNGTNAGSTVPVTVMAAPLSGKTVTAISGRGDSSFALYLPDTITPDVAYTLPAANAKISRPSFGAGSIGGTASDDQGVSRVKVRLSRKRDGVNQFWNGTNFISNSQTFVDADLAGAGTPNATWNLNTNVPPIGKLDDGSYGVRIYALDTSGNQSAPVDRFFSLVSPVVDKTVPTVTIASPTNAQVLDINAISGNILSGTATDNIGVTVVKLKLQRKRNGVLEYWNGTDFVITVALFNAAVTTPGGNSANWQLASAIPAAKMDRGGYTLYATAYDAAGNFKTSPSRLFSITGTSSSAPMAAAGSSTAAS